MMGSRKGVKTLSANTEPYGNTQLKKEESSHQWILRFNSARNTCATYPWSRSDAGRGNRFGSCNFDLLPWRKRSSKVDINTLSDFRPLSSNFTLARANLKSLHRLQELELRKNLRQLRKEYFSRQYSNQRNNLHYYRRKRLYFQYHRPSSVAATYLKRFLRIQLIFSVQLRYHKKMPYYRKRMSSTLPSRTFERRMISRFDNLNEDSGMTLTYVENMDETEKYIHNHAGYFSTRMRSLSCQGLTSREIPDFNQKNITITSPILCGECLKESLLTKTLRR